jgi:hypothetical protein
VDRLALALIVAGFVFAWVVRWPAARSVFLSVIPLGATDEPDGMGRQPPWWVL